MALELVVGAGLLSILLFLFYHRQTQVVEKRLNPPVIEFYFKAMLLVGVFVLAVYAIGFGYFSSRTASESTVNTYGNVTVVTTFFNGSVANSSQNLPVIVSSVKTVTETQNPGEQTLMISLVILVILFSFLSAILFVAGEAWKRYGGGGR